MKEAILIRRRVPKSNRFGGLDKGIQFGGSLNCTTRMDVGNAGLFIPLGSVGSYYLH